MDNKDKGICRMSMVAMRNQPEYAANMDSQLLFGEHYTVVQEEGDWLKIRLHYDSSEGWIPINQHAPISLEYFDQINLSDYKVCTDISGTIFFQKKYVNIVLGSILPITTNELFKMEEQVAFNGSSKSLSQRREVEFLLEIVKHYLHAPYLPGGKGPFGIDGGGFIQQVFKIGGYQLPRTMREQKKLGEEIEDQNAIKPGDLVFSTNKAVSAGFICLSENEYAGMYQGAVSKLQDLNFLKHKLIIKRILKRTMMPVAE